MVGELVLLDKLLLRNLRLSARLHSDKDFNPSRLTATL